MDSSEMEKRLRAWQAGDLDAAGPLVESLARPLLAAAYRHTGDWESARDLAQEAWLHADAAIAGFDPDRPFRPWLFAILRNLGISRLRRPALRRELVLAPEALARRDERRARNEGPARLLSRDFWRQLARALPLLSERQREVFTLVDLREIEQAEAARRLSMKDGTLRATLHQARRKLARALQDQETDP